MSAANVKCPFSSVQVIKGHVCVVCGSDGQDGCTVAERTDLTALIAFARDRACPESVTMELARRALVRANLHVVRED